MKSSQARIGRIFIVKMEDNDRLPDAIEEFARDNKISAGICLMLGGIGKGKLVSGPEKSHVFPIVPILQEINGVHEILGVGTIFIDENNFPKLHMHVATGRKKNIHVGCIRPGISVWKIVEFIIIELNDSKMYRKKDENTGFSILEPE